MSHFTVLVIGDNIEEQLEPFNENTTVPRYSKGLVPDKEIESFVKTYTTSEGFTPKELQGRIDEIAANAKLSFDELYAKYGNSWNGNSWEKTNEGWEEFSTYNPNSKWDWYQIGGRWAGTLKLKDDVDTTLDTISIPNFSWGWSEESKQAVIEKRLVDSAPNSFIDWDGMCAEYKQNREKSYDKFLRILNGEEEGNIYINTGVSGFEELTDETYDANNPMHYVSRGRNTKFRYPTREEFVGKTRQTFTYAILKDGKWYSRGEMGWFGMSNDKITQDEWSNIYWKLIEETEPDTLMTVVDCHI